MGPGSGASSRRGKGGGIGGRNFRPSEEICGGGVGLPNRSGSVHRRREELGFAEKPKRKKKRKTKGKLEEQNEVMEFDRLACNAL